MDINDKKWNNSGDINDEKWNNLNDGINDEIDSAITNNATALSQLIGANTNTPKSAKEDPEKDDSRWDDTKDYVDTGLGWLDQGLGMFFKIKSGGGANVKNGSGSEYDIDPGEDTGMSKAEKNKWYIIGGIVGAVMIGGLIYVANKNRK